METDLNILFCKQRRFPTAQSSRQGNVIKIMFWKPGFTKGVRQFCGYQLGIFVQGYSLEAYSGGEL